MKKILLYSFIVIIVSEGCKKNNDHVTIHCDNLVNDMVPGDQGAVFVASAFTPNGDGMNDLFRPVTVQVSSIKVKVYDKNSNLVFQTDQPGVGWNPAPPLPRNIKYYYRIEAVTINNSKIGLCGEVYPLTCIPGNVSNVLIFEDQITPFGFTGITSESLPNCN
jgi:gliding motility-associated-like protein